MKKLIFLLVVILIVFPELKAQIAKGNWLVGGSGSYYTSHTTRNYPNNYRESKDLDLYATPDIGYFLADRFALGLRPYFSWIKEKESTNGGVSTSVKRYGIGPFSRYYLLNSEKPFNILTEACYQYGEINFWGLKGPTHNFSVSAGPVLYFNNCVGVEFTLGYASRSERYGEGYHSTQKGMQVGIGLQIHLERE